MNKIKSERGEITTNTSDTQKIIRVYTNKLDNLQEKRRSDSPKQEMSGELGEFLDRQNKLLEYS